MTISEEDLRKHRAQWAENQATLRKISDQRAQFAAMAMKVAVTFDVNGELSIRETAKKSVLLADELINELSK